MTPLAQLLEAALFGAARPLTAEELGTLDAEATVADVRVALEQIREHYDFEQHGVELVEMAGGYQILTRPIHAAAIERAHFSVRTPKLSAAAMETLAVIAYRQPVGRGEALGRPLLYGTAPMFLELLGLRDLTDLPRAEELTIALRPHHPGPEGADDAAAYVEAES